MFWAIVIALIAIALALAWNKDRKRRAVRSPKDGFGNHAEQRHLEEHHGVTMHGGPGADTGAAATRQGQGSSISYYGSNTGVNGGGYGAGPS